MTVTVTSVNDVPVARNDAVTLQEDTSITVQVLANDTDADGDTLTIASVTTPGHGTAVIQNGAVRYTPAANFHGSDGFSYTVSDGRGGSDSAQVTVTVTSVNDVPVAQNDTATTAEEQAVVIAVVANDTDADGDTLTVLSVGTPAHGTAVRNADQTVTYTPAANYQGSDTFSYTVSDGQGGSDNAQVTVTVTATSDAPVANDDVATTPEDQAVVVAVVANDTDADGDPLAVVSVTQPAHGVSAREGATAVRYTPAANYHGPDSFTYTISDGNGGTATATVAVTVTSVNDRPVAAADAAETQENQAVTVSVLSNDTDADGDVLEVTSLTQPSHGTAVIVGGVTVRYTPAADYSGTDLFSYTISDGQRGHGLGPGDGDHRCGEPCAGGGPPTR